MQIILSSHTARAAFCCSRDQPVPNVHHNKQCVQLHKVQCAQLHTVQCAQLHTVQCAQLHIVQCVQLHTDQCASCTQFNIAQSCTISGKYAIGDIISFKLEQGANTPEERWSTATMIIGFDGPNVV